MSWMTQQDWDDYAQAIEKIDPARARLIREHAESREVAVITAGTVFDTEFEKQCVALEAPHADGSFSALDSDGVECRFITAMVIGHADFQSRD